MNVYDTSNDFKLGKIAMYEDMSRCRLKESCNLPLYSNSEGVKRFLII